MLNSTALRASNVWEPVRLASVVVTEFIALNTWAERLVPPVRADDAAKALYPSAAIPSATSMRRMSEENPLGERFIEVAPVWPISGVAASGRWGKVVPTLPHFWYL